jgi:type IX secretion system PorP/SprF family membrane protein
MLVYNTFLCYLFRLINERFSPMKERLSLMIVAFVLIVSISQAQDQANFTQFYLNPYILNASYAGIDGKTAMSLIYRKQWAGFTGSPTISNLSLHTPVNKRVSTGLSITSDKRGILTNTSLLLTFGYNIPLQEHSMLRFGISAGGSWNMIDLKKLDNITDNALLNLTGGHASLVGNTGVSYHSKTFHMGISLPSIFQPSYISADGFTVTSPKAFESVVVNASNRFYFNDNKNVFEPYAIYRLNSSSPSQFELAGILHLNHTLWVGSSYKQQFGISALAGIKTKNSLAVGVSYSLKQSGSSELNKPTFEISLNFLFGVHKKGAPVYSFVDTHKEKERKVAPHSAAAILAEKKAAEELARKKLNAAELAKKKQEEQLALKKEQEALALHQAEINKRIEERKNEQVKPPGKDSLVHNPRFTQNIQSAVNAPTVEGHPEHEAEQLKRLEVHADDPTKHHNDTDHPNNERHEFVKKGNHEKELDVADYVIGGVFKSEPNAKHFSDGLDKLGFDTHFGHLTEKNLWYVYVLKTDNINRAREECARVRKMLLLKDAWLLTVHP